MILDTAPMGSVYLHFEHALTKIVYYSSLTSGMWIALPLFKDNDDGSELLLTGILQS